MRKLLISILLGLVTLFSFAPYWQAFAQSSSGSPTTGTWFNQDFFDWYHKVYNDQNPSDIFGERYTAAQVQWVVYSLISLPLNMDPDTQKVVACFFGIVGGSSDVDTCGQSLLDRFKKFDQYFKSLSKTGYNNTNAPFLAQLFDYKNRPISGIGYLAGLKSKLSIVQPAYAQAGFGYTALNPIQKYWTGFRNIAYALFVLVAIIFAFLIMFRVKLNPQTVVSVQSALPKIIGAIVLVTFSYAISGFMIDLMYIIGGLLAALVVAAGFASNITGPFGTFNGVNSIFPSNATGLYFITHMLVYDIFFLLSVVINFVASALSVVQVLPSAIFAIIGILLVVWLLILMIWYSFKATWVLIKTLISVYIAIITSPLQFLLGTLVPSMGFGNWFKRLLADLLVFPVTGLLMIFAWQLMWTSYKFAGLSFLHQNIISQIVQLIIGWTGGNTDWFNTLWTPEILGFGQSISGFLFLFVSFACITLIPKVPDLLKAMILGERFSFGQAMGEAMGPVNTVWGMTGGVAQRSWQEYQGAKWAQRIYSGLESAAARVGMTNLSQSLKTQREGFEKKILHE